MTDKEEDIRFYTAYAQAVIAGLERLQNRVGSLTPPQEAELAINKIALGVLQPQHADLHEKLNPAPQYVPVSAVVVPDEPTAAGGRCLLCFAENVNVTPDPDGVPRCASCWEDLQPCVNCGTVSTRPGGEHYCTATPKEDSKP